MTGANSNTLGSMVASIDIVPRGPNDKIPDDIVAEIYRRGIITWEASNAGNVILSPTPPEDLTKTWIQSDPVTGFALKNAVKRWDSVLGSWEKVNSEPDAAFIPKRRFAYYVAVAGNSVQNVPFEDIGTTNFKVTVTPVTFNPGTNAWAAAHTSIPNGYTWEITNKTSNSITMNVFAAPTGGMTYEIDIEERPE